MLVEVFARWMDDEPPTELFHIRAYIQKQIRTPHFCPTLLNESL